MTNPIDGTGAIYDDPTLLPKLFDTLSHEPDRPVIASSVSARPVGRGVGDDLAEPCPEPSGIGFGRHIALLPERKDREEVVLVLLDRGRIDAYLAAE